MNENETPGQRARRLLEGATDGPWRCDQYDVIPARTVSEGWLIADCGTSDSPDAADANARLIAAAPDLARDLIAESAAHEVTRAALADALQERLDLRHGYDTMAGALGMFPGATPEQVVEFVVRLSTSSAEAEQEVAECPACKGNGWGDALEGEDDAAPCAACLGTGLAS